MEINTQSPEETQELGKRIGKFLRGGEIICLYGSLGSGKTTFVQGLAKNFKINRLPSPTFIIVRHYPIKKGTIRDFYHIDLYRIEKEGEVENLGLEDFFNPNSVVVIEWAEKCQKYLPKERIDICFNYESENKRKINIFSDSLCKKLKKPSKS